MSTGISPYGDSARSGSINMKPQYTPPQSSSAMDMDAFMRLLATQLQNQDMSNPMSNSEMMGQLTSMATVQAMNTVTDLSSSQYALSMMGQSVTVGVINSSGKLEYKTGVVSGLDMVNMKIYLEGDKTPYGFGNIAQVGTVPKPDPEVKPEDKPDPDKPDVDKPENKPENKPEDDKTPGTGGATDSGSTGGTSGPGGTDSGSGAGKAMASRAFFSDSPMPADKAASIQENASREPKRAILAGQSYLQVNAGPGVSKG